MGGQSRSEHRSLSSMELAVSSGHDAGDQAQVLDKGAEPSLLLTLLNIRKEALKTTVLNV